MRKSLTSWWFPIVALALICVVAGVVYLYMVGAHGQKVRAACNHARALVGEGLLEEARRASTSPEGYSLCPGVAGQLGWLREQRAESFEKARLRRRAAHFARGNVPANTTEYWRELAFDAYLEGLDIDPAFAGARHGLRALLRSGRPRSRFEVETHCTRAWRLLHTRLYREARAEYVRVRAAGRVCTGEIAATLRARRRDAHKLLLAAEDRERADDRAAAWSQYRKAAAIDPNLKDALEGLARTRPEIPAPVSIAVSDVPKTPALVGLLGFFIVVIFFVVMVGVATFLRALRSLGNRPGFSRLYHWAGAGRLIAERLEIRALKPLSGTQWKALHDAVKLLGAPPSSAGLPATVTTEAVLVTAAAPTVETDAVAAMPLLERLDAIARFGRHIAGKRRHSVSVEPVGDEGFCVQAWIAWDGTPRGSRERVVDVPGAAGITDTELAWLLTDAIRAQKESE